MVSRTPLRGPYIPTHPKSLKKLYGVGDGIIMIIRGGILKFHNGRSREERKSSPLSPYVIKDGAY